MIQYCVYSVSYSILTIKATVYRKSWQFYDCMTDRWSWDKVEKSSNLSDFVMLDVKKKRLFWGIVYFLSITITFHVWHQLFSLTRLLAEKKLWGFWSMRLAVIPLSSFQGEIQQSVSQGIRPWGNVPKYCQAKLH